MRCPDEPNPIHEAQREEAREAKRHMNETQRAASCGHYFPGHGRACVYCGEGDPS